MNYKVKIKEIEEIEKYLYLAKELKKPWDMKVTVIPLVFGALARVPKKLEKEIKNTDIGGRTETNKPTRLLRSS